jgi:hypothetical protein
LQPSRSHAHSPEPATYRPHAQRVVNDIQDDYATTHTAAVDISADVDRTPQAWGRTVRVSFFFAYLF